MYTKAETVIENGKVIVIPPLPLEAVLRLPSRIIPKKNNIATQYYFWNIELQKENGKLKNENEKLNQKIRWLENEKAELEKQNESLQSQKNRFLDMLFKKRKPNLIKEKHKPIQRARESYIREIPKLINGYKTATMTNCPCCNNKLSEKVDSYQRTIEDIPDYEQLKTKVIQYTINRYYCKHCRKIISAKPNDVIPKSRLGINTLLNVLHSKYRLRLSHDLIRENLKTQFNLNVSDGEITNLLEKGSKSFQNKWQEIIETIKHSKVVNGDETSWRIGPDKAWLWTFVGDKTVRYTISETRGKGVPAKALGGNYDGVIISDFYAAYNQFKHKQRCWVHLLRKARELCQDKPTKEHLIIKNKLSRIYQDILLFRLNKNATQIEKNLKAEQIKNQLQNFRIKSGNENGENLQKLLNLCKKFSGELVVCVSDFAVSPENNTAERAIRPAVLMRKISGGSRSKKGAKIHETNLSVIETINRENRKQDIYPAIKNLVLNYLTSNG